MAEKILLLLKIEKAYFVSRNLSIMLSMIYLLITALGSALAYFYSSEETCGVFFNGVSNGFLQFAHLGFSFILLNSFSREHVNKNYFWFRKHLYQDKDIILAKYLFYSVVILVSAFAYLSLVAIVAKFLVFRDTTLTLFQLFKVIGIVIPSLLFIITLQLVFGYFTNSFFRNIGLWILYWFVTSILNSVIPVLSGYISVLDASSLQSAMISYLLSGEVGLFGKSRNLVNLNNYYGLSIILPLLYSSIIFGVFWGFKRRK